MTLQEKLDYIRKNHPEVYEAICIDAPSVVENPTNPSERDLDHYNFWVDAIDEDEAQPLYHLVS